MGRRHKAALASRRRAASRLQKLRGSLKGKPFLLEERRGSLPREERRPKEKQAKEG